MQDSDRSSLTAYLVALVVTAVAVIVRWLIDPLLGELLPLPTLFAAIAFVVWFSSWRPALLAAFVGYIACRYLFISPRNGFAFDFPNVIGLVRYLISVAIIVGFGEGLRNARRRAEAFAVSQKRDEAAAAAARRQLQIVTDCMAAPVTRCSQDLRYLWVSKSYAEWIGHAPEEIIGRPIREVIGQAAYEQLLPHFEQVLAGKKVRYEELVDYKELGRRWVDAMYTPTVDVAGAPDGWVAVVLDITERKRLEEALRESEQRFRLMADAAPVLIWISDAHQFRTWFNKPWLEFVGRSMEQELENGWTENVHPDDCERFFQGCSSAFTARGPFSMEYRLRRHDGEYRWILDDGVPQYDSGGEFTGYIGSCIDITDRKRAEETVRSLLRISGRLNSTLSLDELLEILVREARELVGAEAGVAGLRTPEGMVCRKYFRKSDVLPLEYCWPPMHGLPGWLLVHKVPYLTNDAKSDQQIIQGLCDRFGVWSALSTPIISAGGEVLGFFELHNKRDGSGFTGSDQEVLVAVSQTAAISVQNALAYHSLQQAEEALKQSDRRKDEFLATLAHELRNPLAPIRNAVELIKSAEGTSPLIDEARGLMERQVRQIVRLVDDLLDISRITGGKMRLRKTRVQLRDVVESAVETSRPLIEASAHVLTVSLPSEPIFLDADPTRLSQVFSNLLNNAAKFTDKGGHVWLTGEKQNGEAIVSVRDTGIGIAAEHLPRVFEMFSQAAPALERSHSGLGIGLSLVRGLVELHGGKIDVRSAGSGLGCEFTVHLPVASPIEAVEQKSSIQGETPSVSSKCRILVVDDNRDAADSTALMLRLRGHETQTAGDGLEALQAAGAFRPGVILLDIGLPKMNGYEVAQRIRQEPWGRQMVLVALTGWGQDEDKRRAREAGCDHHLTKPVDVAALENLLALGTPHPAA